MTGHYRLDAVRGHLLEMAGNREAAIAHYRAAAARTTSVPERNYLATKAARLAADNTGPRTTLTTRTIPGRGQHGQHGESDR